MVLYLQELNDYEVPIIDMFLFLYDQYKEGYVTLDRDLDDALHDDDTLHDATVTASGKRLFKYFVSLTFHFL